MSSWRVVVLGVAQDAGWPQVGCGAECCRDRQRKHVTSLALVHLPAADERGVVRPEVWLFDISPDFREQHGMLLKHARELVAAAGHTAVFQSPFFRPDQEIALRGVFLTHAHIGHYAGLLFLGKEALDAKCLPVYAAPRFAEFLHSSGPWSQLLTLGNITLERIIPSTEASPLFEAASLHMGAMKVGAFAAPHRGEYSETLGFVVAGQLLYLPDVDHWDWDIDLLLRDHCATVALLDGTFFSPEELPGRDIRLIPHPFVSHSLQRLASHSHKVCFTHFNHTNPLLWDPFFQSQVTSAGFSMASEFQVFSIQPTNH